MNYNVFKYFRLTSWIIASLLLGGCVSSSQQIDNYYLIESTATTSTVNSDKKIILSPIELSDYLKSINLHVRSDESEIIYSATDFWAEQPAKMLWRFMAQNLQTQTGHHVLTSYDNTKNSCAQIRVRINELSPGINGDIVSSGRWFISKGEQELDTNTFIFNSKLKSDGYIAANKVFASHLNDLSANLVQQLSRLSLCQ